MAIKINVATTSNKLAVASGAIIKPVTHFPEDQKEYDENGDFTGKKRFITMDLFGYSSVADFLSTDASKIFIDQFPTGFKKEISDAEFSALMANGTLAEVWLKDWIETFVGVGNCEVIDPYA